MKKYLLIAALVMLGTSVSHAEQRDTPTGPLQALATADYGGVMYATAAFGPLSGTGVAVTTVVPSGQGVFYGVLFSTGPGSTPAFVDVFDSTFSPTQFSDESGMRMARLYNLRDSTAALAGEFLTTSGFTGPPWPIQFKRGLLFRPSVATFNCITVLYYKKPD